MAEDICRKSAIIETYVMDSRIGNPQSDDAAAESDQQFRFCFPPICASGSSFGSYGLFYQPAPQTGSYIWLMSFEVNSNSLTVTLDIPNIQRHQIFLIMFSDLQKLTSVSEHNFSSHVSFSLVT